MGKFEWRTIFDLEKQWKVCAVAAQNISINIDIKRTIIWVAAPVKHENYVQ